MAFGIVGKIALGIIATGAISVAGVVSVKKLVLEKSSEETSDNKNSTPEAIDGSSAQEGTSSGPQTSGHQTA